MDFELITKELKESKVQTAKYIGISDGTIKTYIAKVKYLEKQEVLNEKLNDYINTVYTNINSKAAYQIAVMGVAKHSPTFLEILGKDILEIITKENEKIMNEIKGNPKQDKNAKEEENWIPLKNLKKLAKDRKEDFNVQDQLLIAMYTLMPPVRLDLHDVKIIRSTFIDEETKRPEGVDEKQNYIRIFKKSGRTYTDLVLNEYKTNRTYGVFNERLPKPITDIILQLPVSQSHLFQKKGGDAFSSPETFGVYLRSVFKKLTGKNMSVDLLRHIYLTDFRKGEKSDERKQKVAKKMMSSVNEQTNYLRKDTETQKIV
jgi:DNA-binding CsgD family transcriptional regulator